MKSENRGGEESGRDGNSSSNLEKSRRGERERRRQIDAQDGERERDGGGVVAGTKSSHAL